MTTHDLVGGHTRKHLMVLNSKNILCPHQGQTCIIPDARRSRTHLFLTLVRNTLPLWARGNFLHRGCKRSSPRGFRDKVNRVIKVPFSTTLTTFFPKLERGSFFLARILAYNSSLNLVIISVRR